MPERRPVVDLALLCGVIVATLALTWSDGPYISDVVDPVAAPTAAFTAPVGGYADAAHVRAPAPPPPPLPPEPVVPSAQPATILIPSLDVHRPVEAVGVDRLGRMYAPQNAWNGGWYKDGPVPGAPGDAVIEGHAGYPNAPLLFGKLRQLRKGDKIVVVLADGSRQIFLMTSESVWRAGTAPPDLGEPYGDPRLTLITCTGPFDAHYKTYADRLVVQASYAGAA
jgi:LPXTG-site transpeptidase (sortase) family protein